MFKAVATAALVAVGTLTGASMSLAETWKPNGPITLKISFRAGGGTDTQARLIASELAKRHGWEIIPQNVAGKGGAVMARDLVDDPADGLTIGMTVTEALTYSPHATRGAGYALEDFDLLTTTAGTQMALFAKSSRGWKTLHDVIAAAKPGEDISAGAFSPRVADALYLLSQKSGVDFQTVMVKGGKGSINGVMADDLDIAWGAGPQNKRFCRKLFKWQSIGGIGE
ncbi:tripartite tricarboxylate transporter substrate-binding protein, partial [Ruegeria lacuscaerulensis]|uniref:tripartite tricarboxylate transporter substrate-binding protein n=1 Tax=Ruegeria lacuscaerulensis TaxID=55218 RepID=UPI00235058DC